MSGWIKVHRTVIDHWVFEDERYFKAWMTMLLKVNHEPKRVLIHGELIECARGQSVLSLSSWVKVFGRKWTIKKVRIFFDLLKNDEMILTEGLQKTTRLTICNYESYQDTGQTEGKQKADRGQGEGKEAANKGQQLKNEKNYKNEKKDNMSPAGDGDRSFEKSILEIIRVVKSEKLGTAVAEYKLNPERIRLITKCEKEFRKQWPEPERDFLKACKYAFEYKAKEWFGTEMFKHFKPETLLRHFIEYLEDAQQNKGEPYRGEPKHKEEEKVTYTIPK